jgi:hypothetical protein
MSDEATPAEAEAPKTKAPKAPRRGIGTVINEVLLAGGTNEAALAAVQKEFSKSKATLASVSWYRNKLRKDGKEVPTARAVKKAEAPAEAPAPADPLA